MESSDQTALVVPNKKKKTVSIPIEKPEHRAAFELYLNLGKERSRQKVADMIGRSYQVVERWAIRYNWMRRVNSMNTGGDLAQDILETPASYLQKRKQVLGALDKMLEKYVEIDEKTGVVQTVLLPIEKVGYLKTWYETRQKVLGNDEDGGGKGKNGMNINKAVFIIKE